MEREQCDDIDSMFNIIRSASTRKVLAFDLSAPTMPDMMMSMPVFPTPAVNWNSKLTNEMSNNDNTNTAPMKKKKKKQNHMGRRLCQLKKRLTSKSKTSSSSKQVEEICLSHETSATTSASSFGQTLHIEDDDDAPIFDMMTMMTTTLKPRVQSMFHEEEEMMPIMPVLPAPPCPLSTTSTSTDEERVVVTTTPLASFSSKLDKALSVFSPNDGDDDGDAGADDTADDWGVFASYDDDEEEDDDIEPKYNNFKSKASSRSSFTKHTTTNPCFQPRAHIPVFAATAGAE